MDNYSTKTVGKRINGLELKILDINEKEVGIHIPYTSLGKLDKKQLKLNCFNL